MASVTSTKQAREILQRFPLQKTDERIRSIAEALDEAFVEGVRCEKARAKMEKALFPTPKKD